MIIINLPHKYKTINNQIIDVNQLVDGNNFFIFCLQNNDKIKLKEKDWDYLIDNFILWSDKDELYQFNVLENFLTFAIEKNIKLNDEQIIKILQNYDLDCYDDHDYRIIDYFFEDITVSQNGVSNLLGLNAWKYLIENTKNIAVDWVKECFEKEEKKVKEYIILEEKKILEKNINKPDKKNNNLNKI